MTILAAVCLSSSLPGAMPVYAGDGILNGTVHYTGSIDKEKNRQFFAAIGDRPVRRLVITSPGGEVDAGIELGDWVFDRRLDVVVPRYCLSSCANYVFPAAQRKLIHAGAVVAWHGNYHHLLETGLWADDVARRVARTGEDVGTARTYVLAEVEWLVGLEQAFFRRIGVDQRVCWVGKLPPFSAPDYYILSARDMARFGIDRVEAPPGYARMDLEDLDWNVMSIHLHDDKTGATAPRQAPGD